ncbi:MAG: shikimate dehydrogenase [Syntrophomonadaceae bacterium]
MEIDGSTELLGLIGNPVAHSYSPLLHNSVLQHLKINAVYVPLQVAPQELARAVYGMPALGFKGVNVTIPYKEAVLPYLDALEGDAALCRSVNVIENREGRLIGHNTDGQGFLTALREAGFPGSGKAVFIGSGGAARSLAFTMGASGFSELDLLDTDLQRAEKLADEVRAQIPGKCRAVLMNLQNFRDASREASLVVNCSPVGMHPLIDQSPVEDLSFLDENAALYDIIYNPVLTRFLTLGQSRGLKVLNGLPMFVHQAALTLKILLGLNPPIDYMKAILANEVG